MVCHWSGHWWFFAAFGQATPRISVVHMLHWPPWCGCCLLFPSSTWNPIFAQSFWMVQTVVVWFWEQNRARVDVMLSGFTAVFINALSSFMPISFGQLNYYYVSCYTQVVSTWNHSARSQVFPCCLLCVEHSFHGACNTICTYSVGSPEFFCFAASPGPCAVTLEDKRMQNAQCTIFVWRQRLHSKTRISTWPITSHCKGSTQNTFYVLRIYSAVAAVSLNVNMYIYTQFQGHAQTVSDVIMKQS